VTLQLVSVKNAAARLDVHPDTVRRLLDRGTLTKHVVGARSVRIDARELERYVRGDGTGVEDAPANAPQKAAFHAKCGTLARLRESTKPQVKGETLAEGGRRFGREIESVDELSYDEMHELLDHLEEQIDWAGA
jgi:excisionase family DNA binding protein